MVYKGLHFTGCSKFLCAITLRSSKVLQLISLPVDGIFLPEVPKINV